MFSRERILFQFFFGYKFQTLDELTNDAVPENIRLNRNLHLEKPYSQLFNLYILLFFTF